MSLAGSFIQLAERELSLDRRGWQEEMALLRSLGAHTLVLQFTGDERGPFDRQRPERSPVRTLVQEAAAAGMRVWLGLHADRRWPHGFDFDRELPAPLADRDAAAELVRLCQETPACEGFYLSPEIDDDRGLGDIRRVAAFLSRTTEVLCQQTPGKRISLAPSFTGRLSPQDHAAFWRPLLSADLIDVLMLRDGVGAGRASAKTARLYLESLRQVIPARPTSRRGPIELWSVVELFQQLAGPPRDDRPFVAQAAAFDVVVRSLIEEGAVADRLIAMSMLDYMDPRRGGRASHLYQQYRTWCQSRPARRSLAASQSRWST